jgi:hypothetical protein
VDINQRQLKGHNDMDIHCRNCGEPWENETLHEVAQEMGTTYSKVAKDFSAKGCKAFDGSDYETSHCTADSRAEARGLLADLLGDDLDGYASTMDDLEYMGLLD